MKQLYLKLFKYILHTSTGNTWNNMKQLFKYILHTSIVMFNPIEKHPWMDHHHRLEWRGQMTWPLNAQTHPPWSASRWKTGRKEKTRPAEPKLSGTHKHGTWPKFGCFLLLSILETFFLRWHKFEWIAAQMNCMHWKVRGLWVLARPFETDVSWQNPSHRLNCADFLGRPAPPASCPLSFCCLLGLLTTNLLSEV